jgi:hypothetical protein
VYVPSGANASQLSFEVFPMCFVVYLAQFFSIGVVRGVSKLALGINAPGQIPNRLALSGSHSESREPAFASNYGVGRNADGFVEGDATAKKILDMARVANLEFLIGLEPLPAPA